MLSGSSLLHYRLAEKIGEGGMGQVWRATDSTLGRDVAIKILPPEFAADPERLARFDREAKVLASLNHPNIAAIHGFHEAEGVRFLAMEMVPGEGLDQRMSRGPIPTEEAKGIALKIAEALEYAHERGIVHRDLKPANIRITPDGPVKVLDFGLAKAIVGDPTMSGPVSTPTILPTLTSAGTAVGMILGTAAYMSPEQARGRPVDKRADIWAFGVVAVEMLTGRRLFEGETVSDTIAGVLTRPIEVDALPYASLWKRCLERDAKLRLRDIGEARIALERPAGTKAASSTPSRAPWIVAAAALALAVVAGFWPRTSAPPAATQRYALSLPDGLNVSNTEFPQIAISSDGRRQVVVAVGSDTVPRLLLRSDEAFEPTLLPDTERATAPFFSPDGLWIAFFRDGGLFKIPTTGGAPIRIAPTGSQIRGGTWSRDGHLYFTSDSEGGLSRVSEKGGPVQVVTTLDEGRNERTHRWPSALPDGSAVLFTCDDAGSTEYYDDARIEAVRPATGERKVLFEGASQARYAAGHLVVARGGSLFAVPIDPQSLEVRGAAKPAVQGVATDVSSGAVNFSISESGSALWVPGSTEVAYRFVWIDRAGRETPAAVPRATYNEAALSPDGRRVALTGGEGGNADLWVYDLERGSVSRLTSGQTVQSPVWTHDGTKIAYAMRLPRGSQNLWQILWKDADGSRDPEVLFEGTRGHLPSSFTSDGKALLYDRLDDSPDKRDIWLLPLEGKREPRVLVGGPFSKDGAVVSPDGRWVAYVSREGGQSGVYVRPFPDGPGRWQVSAPFGVEPHWSADGKELFYRSDGALYVVRIDTSRGFDAGRPERLFDRVAMNLVFNSFGVSPDGQRIFTFRAPDGIGSRRTVHLDLGFAGRLER
ncbi:MAG TPA: protein kinase [Candidatus Polarisedimenticolaceae bacterium]